MEKQASVTYQVSAEVLKGIYQILEDEDVYHEVHIKRMNTEGLWRITITCEKHFLNYFRVLIKKL